MCDVSTTDFYFHKSQRKGKYFLWGVCECLHLSTTLRSHWNSPFQSVLWMTALWSNTTIVYFYISQYFVGFTSHRVLFGEDQSYFDLAKLWNMPWLGLPLKNIFLSCISVLIDLIFTFICDKSQKMLPQQAVTLRSVACFSFQGLLCHLDK